VHTIWRDHRDIGSASRHAPPSGSTLRRVTVTVPGPEHWNVTSGELESGLNVPPEGGLTSH
jgi:hypothetical protein